MILLSSSLYCFRLRYANTLCYRSLGLNLLCVTSLADKVALCVALMNLDWHNFSVNAYSISEIKNYYFKNFPSVYWELMEEWRWSIYKDIGQFYWDLTTAPSLAHTYMYTELQARTRTDSYKIMDPDPTYFKIDPLPMSQKVSGCKCYIGFEIKLAVVKNVLCFVQ